MKRLTISALVALLALTTTQIAFADDSVRTAPSVTMQEEAPAKCKRTTFKTALVKNACKKGQKAASKAMKAFTKKAKKATGEKVTCKTCHTAMKKEGYPLKADGMATFKKMKAAIDAAKIRPHLTQTEQHAVESWLR
ncbi:MAG: hypothetical protein ACPGU1_06385 [Myxococcota bacterium]